MSRQARAQSSTDYYHVMIRGNNRERVFSEDKQKRYFLESLKMQNEDNLVDIVAFCIMDNHAHIVVKANILDLTKAIKRVKIRYAMNFNQKQDRIGHVFQERFRSEAIENDKYLLQVIKNSVYLEEIVQKLLKGSRLSHRQIASLLGISNNVVHKASLHKD